MPDGANKWNIETLYEYFDKAIKDLNDLELQRFQTINVTLSVNIARLEQKITDLEKIVLSTFDDFKKSTQKTYDDCSKRFDNSGESRAEIMHEAREFIKREEVERLHKVLVDRILGRFKEVSDKIEKFETHIYERLGRLESFQAQQTGTLAHAQNVKIQYMWIIGLILSSILAAAAIIVNVFHIR